MAFAGAGVNDDAAQLEEYGTAVVGDLLRPGPASGNPSHATGRRALLDASARVDKAALARFGASFLKAYPSPTSSAPAAPPAPSSPELAPAEEPAKPSTRLTMQEYAALRAECMNVPTASLGDVRARHGLDAASEELEVAAWGRAFAKDPSLFERYKALFRELRKNPPPVTAKVAPPAPQAPGGHRLSVHQYASLRAECMSVPVDGLGEVRARYGLDAQSEAAEVEAWGRAFAGNAALFEQYKSLFRYFRSMAQRSA